MNALGPVAAALWRVAHSTGRRGAAFDENIASPSPYGHVKYALGSFFKKTPQLGNFFLLLSGA